MGGRQVDKAQGMNQPLQREPTPEQKQSLERLAGLFKGKQPPYMPVLKALEAIGINPKVMNIMLGDEPIECLVVPMQEMIFKEWKHMSQVSPPPVDDFEPQREETNNDDHK